MNIVITGASGAIGAGQAHHSMLPLKTALALEAILARTVDADEPGRWSRRDWPRAGKHVRARQSESVLQWQFRNTWPGA